jgi:hypothetical protein
MEAKVQDEGFQEGYDRAKEEDEALLQQAVEAGSVLAFREVVEALKDVQTTDGLIKVVKDIERAARLP